MVDPDDEAREARLTWRAERVQSDMMNAPDGLWHYTDAGGLQAILTTETLWASDPRFLNDATEFNYGLDVAEEAVLAAASSGRWDRSTSHFLRRVMASDGANLTGFLRVHSEVFVACFCADGDLLSQWRAYAGRDSAGGCALRFQHREPLSGWIDHRPRKNLQLQRVIYDRGQQLTAFSGLVDRLAPIYEDGHSERSMAAVSKNLVDGILEFATFCKHPSFEEENEWRVVYERSSDAHPLEVQHRVSKGLFIPYVALKLPAAVGKMAEHLPISEVRCGPSSDPELKQFGVQKLLRSSGIFRGVDVSGSNSPLRL